MSYLVKPILNWFFLAVDENLVIDKILAEDKSLVVDKVPFHIFFGCRRKFSGNENTVVDKNSAVDKILVVDNNLR